MGSGRQIEAAFKQSSVWGTPVVCGAGDGLKLLTESINPDFEWLPDESFGSDFILDGDTGATKLEFQTSGYLRYLGLDVLLAMILGDPGTPAQQGATTAYANTLELLASIEGLFGTLCLQRPITGGASVVEIDSAKPVGFTLRGEAGKRVEIAIDWLGRSVSRVSTTNTTTTMASVTYPTTGLRVLMRQGAFWFNDQSDGALDSGDAVLPSKFELVFKRALTGELVAGSGSDTIDEPDENGFPTLTLKLDFPRYTADTRYTEWTAGTLKKGLITFTGAVIESPYYNTLALHMPQLRLTKVEEPTNGASKIPQSVTYELQEASAAPTGMSYTLPLTISTINTRSTAPLS